MVSHLLDFVRCRFAGPGSSSHGLTKLVNVVGFALLGRPELAVHAFGLQACAAHARRSLLLPAAPGASRCALLASHELLLRRGGVGSGEGA